MTDLSFGPAINKEKIVRTFLTQSFLMIIQIFCIDLDEEGEELDFSEGEEKQTRLGIVKSFLKRFITIKSMLNSQHEYAVCTLTSQCNLAHEFTTEVDDIIQTIESLNSDTFPQDTLDMSSIIQMVCKMCPEESGRNPKPGCQFMVHLFIIYFRTTRPAFYSHPTDESDHTEWPLLCWDTLFLTKRLCTPEEKESKLKAYHSIQTSKYEFSTSHGLRKKFDIDELCFALMPHPLARKGE
ncbi:hypothetical protein PROFUN_09172 [Planoprotostelium fungivorum]|uniref:Uncharacterized protein n=1 Tax=Planoprotostelium fungivorum TaxID=1890364 RepID=A0A2P6MVK4_9EUKA|nr:hypothetical protein PROFUN_09172 [Planoprotostelium fungivorum]